MSEKNRIDARNLSRRGFLAVGSAAAAASALPLSAGEAKEEEQAPRGIVQWRRLGRGDGHWPGGSCPGQRRPQCMA